MIRVYVFCEGQTEETFVRELLQPHFNGMAIFLYPIVVRTSKRGKGGVSTYGKIKSQIEKKCKEEKSAWVTTLLDYYQFPKDFLTSIDEKPSIDRAREVQEAFERDISHDNFIANLVVHEFEGLLFASPQSFKNWFDNNSIIKLIDVRREFSSPEHINDGVDTAPSKRILNICDSYDKVWHGSLIAIDIGLDAIRKECRLFDGWIRRLEALVDGS